MPVEVKGEIAGDRVGPLAPALMQVNHVIDRHRAVFSLNRR
jgi:hypothetical protein